MRTPVALLLLFSALGIFAQPGSFLPAAIPEELGFSSVRLGRIDTLMQQYVDQNKLPGMITLVARRGEIVHFNQFGLMDEGKPMRRDAVFRIASMTKPVTSVAVMILFGEGRFQLDDPVSRYIPEFGHLKVFSARDKDGIKLADQEKPMTIRQLLTHTSGLASGFGDTPVDSMYGAAGLSSGTLHDMIIKLADIPLLYQPGTRWVYGRSTDVLAYLVEAISGKRFDIFLKERIFDPLGMSETGFYVPADRLDRVPAVYTPDDSAGIRIMMKPDSANAATPVRFLSGNGGLVTTTHDYAIFCQMLLGKGFYKGTKILDSSTAGEMTRDQLGNVVLPDDDFFGPMMKDMGFGLGFAVVKDNNQPGSTGSAGSYWWSGSGNTYFFIDPGKEMFLLFMSQFVPNYYYPVFREFREAVYSAMR